MAGANLSTHWVPLRNATLASDTSPFGTDCNTQPRSGALYLDSEVEPWLDVDSTSASDEDGPDFIGVYQQDRYETGGARGLGTSISTDGGVTFEQLTQASCQTSANARAIRFTSAPRILGELRPGYRPGPRQEPRDVRKQHAPEVRADTIRWPGLAASAAKPSAATPNGNARSDSRQNPKRSSRNRKP